MSREVEYRRYAAALLDLSKRAADAADKVRLLVIADAWLKLADRIVRLPDRLHSDSTHHRRAGRTAGQGQPKTE